MQKEQAIADGVHGAGDGLSAGPAGPQAGVGGAFGTEPRSGSAEEGYYQRG